MTDLRRQAEELMTLAAVKASIEAEYRRRHQKLQAEYETLGLERQRVTLPDGTDFGLAVLAASSIYVEVIDREAMLDWLEANRPDEIVTTHDIRPSFWRALQEAAKKAGVGVDPGTGERLDWIRVSVGERSLRVTPTHEAKQLVKRLLNTNQLILPELEADETPLHSVREAGSS